ncbi:MAG: trypsin-like serine protease [Gammaproteobacteria bacterium]|nr:trypsin-like serine protease [Gammaproteobacteria bacterium]
MKSFAFLGLALVLTMASASSLHSNIYHGDPVANDQQFPAVVAIYEIVPFMGSTMRDQDAECTGTLIADRWVVTAGHCVLAHTDDDVANDKIVSPEKIAVGLGFNARHAKNANTIVSVEKIVTWQDRQISFDPNHDIALLKLSQPVTNISPAQLPESANDFVDLKSGVHTATAVGYGWTSQAARDGILHYGSEVIQPDEIVETLIKKYSAPTVNPSPYETPSYNLFSMLGVTSPTGQHGTSGDSGGPLFSASASNPAQVVIGIDSWGVGDPTRAMLNSGEFDKLPEVYTNLLYAEHLDFVKKTIKNG